MSEENTSSTDPAPITFDQVQKQKNYCFKHLFLLNQKPSETCSARNKPSEDSINCPVYANAITGLLHSSVYFYKTVFWAEKGPMALTQ